MIETPLPFLLAVDFAAKAAPLDELGPSDGKRVRSRTVAEGDYSTGAGTLKPERSARTTRYARIPRVAPWPRFDQNRTKYSM